jgi:hypothetical protein
MNRAALLGFVGAVCLAQGTFAQTAAQPAAKTPASSQTRPDAQYAKPSGQDSQPTKTAPKKATGSSPGQGNVESRGSKTTDQSAGAQGAVKQKAYNGNTGKKTDAGTACSTARATPSGGVDCGTSGEGATPGKVPK